MNSIRLSVVVLITFILVGGAVPSLCTNERQTQEGVDRAFYNYHTAYHRSELPNYYPLDQFTLKKEGVDWNQRNGADDGSQIPTMGPMDSPWPMMSHDVFHTGRSLYNTTQPPEGVEIWRFYASDSFDGGAIVDKEGILYIGDMFEQFYAIYSNGTLKWKTQLATGSVESTPAIDENGVIYIGTIWDPYGNYLYALNSSNGDVKWRYATGNDVDSSPAIGSDGTIYFGDWSGYVHALHPDGTIKWKYHTGDVITGSPAIGPDGTVYIGSHDSILYAFNPDNGTVKWKFDTGGWVRVSPCVGDDGTVYCVSFDNYLYAVYPNNGTMKWKTFVNAGTNPTIGPDGTIYAGWDVLYAVNPDGSVKWTFPGYAYIEGGTPCTSKEGIIYYGTTTGRLMALNSNGTLRWLHSIGACQSPPAIDSNGRIYIGSESPSAFLAFGHSPLKAEAYGQYEGLINTSIQFSGDGFGGALPYTFLWDFGDSHTSNEQNPIHTYTGPGTFNVTLTIQDGAGNSTTDNATTTITYPGPTVRITKPKGGIYVFDIRIIPFPFMNPIIFGPITIEAQATQAPLGISHVDFYADEKFLGTDTSSPYNCVWRGALNPRFKEHGIYVWAYDNGGKNSWVQIIVYKLF
jgi:outer membrane protein assembly factor BamB